MLRWWLCLVGCWRRWRYRVSRRCTGGLRREWDRRRGEIVLRLDPRFDNVKRRSQNTSHATCGSSGEDFERQTNVSTADVCSRHLLLLFPEGELKCREWEVAEKGRLITVE